MKYSGIGGQAVIEGIMMKNKDDYATAVRRGEKGHLCEPGGESKILLASVCARCLQFCGFDDPRHEKSELFGELFRG